MTLSKMEYGFTLIELMIAVAIIGLLSLVAIPSYTQYITRTNRADAQDKLTEVVYELERFNTRNRTYTVDLTQLGFVAPAAPAPQTATLSDQGFYTITAAVCAGAAVATCVNVTATPVVGSIQARDFQADGTTLNTLSLNTRGTRVGPWRR